MDLSEWTYLNQIALDNLEAHLLQCQKSSPPEDRLLVRYAAAKQLQASLRRHADLSLRTLSLLEEQRYLLAQLKARLERRLP